LIVEGAHVNPPFSRCGSGADPLNLARESVEDHGQPRRRRPAGVVLDSRFEIGINSGQ
jgi:hypothetical protein